MSVCTKVNLIEQIPRNLMELLSTHPPKTPMAFHVGVTGHRDLPAPAIPIIARTVTELLESVRDEVNIIHRELKTSGLYEDSPPILRCISPLAEGADMIVARQTLALEFELQSPLPFERTEYEKDFRTPKALAEFRELVTKASAVLELSGSREEAGDAYHAVGSVVLEHCDLLIAIWDEKPPKGLGGTGQIAKNAISLCIPIAIINPAEPDKVRFNAGNCSQEMFTGVRSIIRKQLAVPTLKPKTPASGGFLRKAVNYVAGGTAAGVSPTTYFAETWKHSTVLGKFPSWFERILATQCASSSSVVDWARKVLESVISIPRALLSWTIRGQHQPAPSENATPWCEALLLEDSRTSQMERVLDSHFAWADHLAIHYGGNFRALGLLRHLLMAVVLCGLFIGVYIERINVVGFALQFLAFAAILWLVRINRKVDWHQRFLDYRYIAEHLRHMRYLTLIGRLPGFAHDNVDATCTNESWPAWHLRNMARQCGLAGVRLEPGMLKTYRDLLETEVIDDQIGFFNARKFRYDLISKRLNSFGTICYAVGLTFICLRLIVFWAVGKDTTVFVLQGVDFRVLVNQVVLIVPALASITFGVRSQGEYQRLAARYDLMADMLKQKRQDLRKLILDDSARLAVFAKELAALLASEVSGWHVLVKSKAINPY